MDTRWQQRVVESPVIYRQHCDFQRFDGVEIVALRRNDAKVGLVVQVSSLDTREVYAEGSGIQGHSI